MIHDNDNRYDFDDDCDGDGDQPLFRDGMFNQAWISVFARTDVLVFAVVLVVVTCETLMSPGSFPITPKSNRITPN